MTIPDKATDHAIIRYRYVSNNPFEIYPAENTDAIFYNCADIKILANSNPAPAAPVADIDVNPSTSSCKLPPYIELMGNENNIYQGAIQHHVWYDSNRRMLRWDKTGRIEPTDTSPITLTYLTNYTIEAGPFPAFVINAAKQTC